MPNRPVTTARANVHCRKGLEIPTQEIDLRSGEQLGRLVNPNATVPVLETDGGTRFTSTAACRAYLESEYPEPALLGRNSIERGHVAGLVWKIESDGFMAVAEALRNRAKGMKDRALPGPHNYAQIPELAERGQLHVQRFMPVLDEMIGDKPFVAGDVITAADLDAFIFVEFAGRVKASVPMSCKPQTLACANVRTGQRKAMALLAAWML